MTTPLMLPDLDEFTMAELAPPCEIGLKGDMCKRTAEWFGALKCCGYIYLVCTIHRDSFLDSKPKQKWICTECDTILHGMPFMGFEALNKKP